MPIGEQLFVYVGQIACLLSVAYLMKVGSFKLGTLYLVAFALQFQAGYLAPYTAGDSDSQGVCWASGKSYYDCLPTVFKISIHAAQLGYVLFALSIFLTAKKLANKLHLCGMNELFERLTARALQLMGSNNCLQVQSLRSLDVFSATAFGLRSKAAPEAKRYTSCQQ